MISVNRTSSQDKIDAPLRWQEKTGVLTWVGTWMSGNYNGGNDYSVTEQAVFASFMAEALTKAGIPFAINADSHFFDRENGGFYSVNAAGFISDIRRKQSDKFSSH